MSEPSKSAGFAATFNWQASDLGERTSWPHTLRLSLDILLDSPCPMLLAWGPRKIVVYNEAYAALAGLDHPPAPGARVPAAMPGPLAADLAAYERAMGGQSQHLPQTALALVPGQTLACDLHLTPLREADGQVAGVLYTLAPSTQAPTEASGVPGLRVLVVEDNLDSQYLVCEMLKAFGHQADGVAHGEGALGLLEASSYDVLFSDVSLPGISGVELARQALRRTPALHVIFASGYGEALLRHVDFPFQSLQKPYEIEQLQAALAAVPGQRRHPGGPPNV